MKPIKLPPLSEREKLLETPTEALMELILRQQEVIEQLVEEVERLKSNASSDSRSSSKLPSSDSHKRLEQSQPKAKEDGEAKRKSVMWAKHARDLGG